VRATAFMELWVDLLRQTAARTGRPLIFGHGANPINFVSVRDVAELLDDVLGDPAARGSTIEAIGPQNLTFKQFAATLQASPGGPAGAPRHVPRAMLRLLSVLAAPIKPEQARQARAALAMDTIDLTARATGEHAAARDLPTSLHDVLRTNASHRAVEGATP
jgi:NADH dehydrogenase